MTPTENLLAFSALSLLALLLPILPLLRTALRKPDRRASLRSQAPAAAAAAAQIEAFRTGIHEQFSHLLQLTRSNGPIRAANDKGQPLLVLGTTHHLADELPPASRRLRSLILSAGHLDIPGELICDREIFAAGRINIGHNSLVKSVLSYRDIAIGRRARITRWVHSDRRLDVAESARLKGWASAAQEITLARRSQFAHLAAPRILFGRQQEKSQRPHADTVGRFEPSRRYEEPGHGRKLSIPAHHSFKGNLLLSGSLHIGDHCHIIGDLRADKAIHIGRNVIIEGAIYADGPIHIGPDCQLSGPLVSRSEIRLGSACEIGSLAQPTSLSANTLFVSESCIAYGSVCAHAHGIVVEKQDTP